MKWNHAFELSASSSFVRVTRTYEHLSLVIFKRHGVFPIGGRHMPLRSGIGGKDSEHLVIVSPVESANSLPLVTASPGEEDKENSWTDLTILKLAFSLHLEGCFVSGRVVLGRPPSKTLQPNVSNIWREIN